MRSRGPCVPPRAAGHQARTETYRSENSRRRSGKICARCRTPGFDVPVVAVPRQQIPFPEIHYADDVLERILRAQEAEDRSNRGQAGRNWAEPAEGRVLDLHAHVAGTVGDVLGTHPALDLAEKRRIAVKRVEVDAGCREIRETALSPAPCGSRRASRSRRAVWIRLLVSAAAHK